MFNSVHNQPRKTKAQLLGPMAQVAKKSRFVARNTLEWQAADGSRHIRLHETDIVSFLPNGRIRVTSGGWKTPTTRGRINDALPSGWNVWSRAGLWQIVTPAGEFAFVDGAEFFAASGKPCKPSLHGGAAKSAARDEKLIRAYMAAVKSVDPADLTGAGDPFVTPSGKTLKYNESHVRTWLNERYVFLTFLRAAMAYSGIPADSADYYLHDYKRCGKWPSHVLHKVRRYIRACLGYPT